MYKNTTFLFLLLLQVLFTHAQVPAVSGLPEQWNLEDCIAYGWKNNISLASLRLSSLSTQEDLLQSKAAVLPNLTGSVSFSVNNSKIENNSTGKFQRQTHFSDNFGLNSTLILYNGGYLRNDIRSKTYELQSANLTVKETENDLRLSITQAYFNILLARENKAVFETVLVTSQGQLLQGQQRYDAGSISLKDLLLLESLVATDQYNLTNADNDLKLNTLTLKQLLLLPPAYALQVSAPDSISVPEPLVPVEEAQNKAAQTRPEIYNKETQIRIAEIEILKSRAGAMPVISAGAGMATGFSDFQSASYLSQMNNNFYQTLGINIGIPIFSRRVNKTNINKAKILLLQSRLALQETQNTLSQLVEQTYISLQNAQAQYSAASVRLKISEQVYAITNEQLKMGAINTLDLLLQKNAYLQAIQSFTQAKYTVLLYTKIYEFYMGIPVQF